MMILQYEYKNQKYTQDIACKTLYEINENGKFAKINERIVLRIVNATPTLSLAKFNTTCASFLSVKDEFEGRCCC